MNERLIEYYEIKLKELTEVLERIEKRNVENKEDLIEAISIKREMEEAQ